MLNGERTRGSWMVETTEASNESASLLPHSRSARDASVCPVWFQQNVSRGHPVSESSVTSWLALEADSASPEGRVACLSAIEHLIRHQEGGSSPARGLDLGGEIPSV